MTVSRREFVSAVSTITLVLAERWGIGAEAETIKPPALGPAAPEHQAPAEDSGPALEAPPVAARDVKPLAPFNNGRPADGAAWFGASLGKGIKGQGWPNRAKDLQPMIDLGMRAIRLPLKRDFCFEADGSINTWVLDNLISAARYCIGKGVAFVIDDHKYSPFTNPDIARFWTAFAPAIEKGIGGPNPLFGIELQNEPAKGAKDWDVWAPSLAATIVLIRNAGYKGYIFAGWGDWNNARQTVRAMAEVRKIGGMKALDPLKRTIFTMHDYWGKHSDPARTGNDQSPYVDGEIDIAKRYGPAIDALRAIGATAVMGEIGGGITPQGPMPAYEGKGKDGKQLQQEYFAFAKANRDVLLGSWFWAGGRMGETYRHKVAAGNEHTRSLQQGLWS
ncbi:cellulase family glycosylhydrolase [Sphingomonas sp. Ag1]|jgi:hypothetical protein|uniref:cellulase family glycosylhydrolase n=1 Tax=Sphingomonas sp. Ag1 TaxID=1642949 RepID=UPI0009E5F8BE|nr:cellulase family glycosylhydrolase [Sphingomonas sp. Ag1]